MFNLGGQLLAKLKKCPSLIENTSIQLQELFSNLQGAYCVEYREDINAF